MNVKKNNPTNSPINNKEHHNEKMIENDRKCKLLLLHNTTKYNFMSLNIPTVESLLLSLLASNRNYETKYIVL